MVVKSSSDGWQTVLIGGLRRGGQGYYALNISNPEEFSAKDVLWELTDATTAEIGLTYARPSVGTFENGQTYAVLANGFDNSEAPAHDRQQSQSGKPSLFIVDALQGNVIKTFQGRLGRDDDPSGNSHSNSFAEPALVDTDGNGLVDTIYVGDWFGELYAFDVRDKSAFSWSSYGGTSSNAARPIMAGQAVEYQPITTRPVVLKTQIRLEGVVKTLPLIVYGTGQEQTRQIPKHTEYLMAVTHDINGLTDLVQASQLVQRQLNTKDKLITSVAIEANNSPLSNGGRGWFIKLNDELAEYSISRDLQLLGGELHVTLTQKPTSVSLGCSPDAAGLYKLVLDPHTGGATKHTVYQNSDKTRQTLEDQPVVGQHVNSSQASIRTLMGEDGNTYDLVVENGVISLKERGDLNVGDGRQSWRRLY